MNPTLNFASTFMLKTYSFTDLEEKIDARFLRTINQVYCLLPLSMIKIRLNLLSFCSYIFIEKYHAWYFCHLLAILFLFYHSIRTVLPPYITKIWSMYSKSLLKYLIFDEMEFESESISTFISNLPCYTPKSPPPPSSQKNVIGLTARNFKIPCFSNSTPPIYRTILPPYFLVSPDEVK